MDLNVDGLYAVSRECYVCVALLNFTNTFSCLKLEFLDIIQNDTLSFYIIQVVGYVNLISPMGREIM